MVSEFKRQEGIDLSGDKMAMQRLKEAAEKAKKELSSATTTNINLPFITATADGPKHFDMDLTLSLIHIYERILGNPAFAMDAVLGEVNVMGQFTLENLKKALEGIETGNKDTIRSVFQNEKTINDMEKIMTAFLVQVDNLSLTEEQHQVIKNLFYTVSDLERVGDRAENIAELADNMRKDEVTFSKKGFKDMKLIAEETILALESALKAREFSSASEAMPVSYTHLDVYKRQLLQCI